MVKNIYLQTKKKIKNICLKIYAIILTIIGEYNAIKLKNILLKIVRKKTEKELTILKDFRRLEKITNEQKQLKVNFGCGSRILKNWINIDTFYSPELDDYAEKFFDKSLRGGRNNFFLIDFRDGSLPFSDNSVDVIFSEDFVEHLEQKEFVVFLAETHRILKMGSVNRISAPDLISSMKKKSDFKKGLKGVYTNEWNKYRHINMLTKNYLKELAEMVGYSKIIFKNKNESESNLIPADTRPRDDRTINEQIYCDLIK